MYNRIYTVSKFLDRRFIFEVDLCAFCKLENESLEHFFLPNNRKDFGPTLMNGFISKLILLF